MTHISLPSTHTGGPLQLPVWLHQGRLWKHPRAYRVRLETSADPLHPHCHEAGAGETTAGWNTEPGRPDGASAGPGGLRAAGRGARRAATTGQELPLRIQHGGRRPFPHPARRSFFPLHPRAVSSGGEQLQQRHDWILLLVLRLRCGEMPHGEREPPWGRQRAGSFP